MRKLLKPRSTIIQRGHDVNPLRTSRAFLAESYDGIGQFVLVSMAASSTSGALRAQVMSPDFGSGRYFPKGTPVSLYSGHGKVVILSLGPGGENQSDLVPGPPPCWDYETYPLTEAGYRPPNGEPNLSNEWGDVYYNRAGGSLPEVPIPYYGGTAAWHFGAYQVTDSGSRNGWVDIGFGGLGNSVRLILVGVGIVTIHTRIAVPGTFDPIQGGGGSSVTFAWYLSHNNGINQVLDDSAGNLPPAVDVDVNVPDDGFCVHWIDLNYGGSLGTPVAFDGRTWAPQTSSTVHTNP